MDEINSNESVKSDSESNESFQDLRLSNSEFHALETYDPQKIE